MTLSYALATNTWVMGMGWGIDTLTNTSAMARSLYNVRWLSSATMLDRDAGFCGHSRCQWPSRPQMLHGCVFSSSSYSCLVIPLAPEEPFLPAKAGLEGGGLLEEDADDAVVERGAHFGFAEAEVFGLVVQPRPRVTFFIFLAVTLRASAIYPIAVMSS